MRRSARTAPFDRLWAILITGVAQFMAALDNLVVTTALPVIRRSLGTGLAGLEWTVNAFTLTFAVFLLTGAALGDRFGRRRMFVVGLALFTVSSAAAALAPNIDVARRGPRPPGSRRRAHRAALADTAARPGCPRRAGATSRSASGVPSAGSRSPSGRSSAVPSSRGLSLAVDLLDQRPDRDRAHPARQVPPRRVLW